MLRVGYILEAHSVRVNHEPSIVIVVSGIEDKFRGLPRRHYGALSIQRLHDSKVAMRRAEDTDSLRSATADRLVRFDELHHARVAWIVKADEATFRRHQSKATR